MRPRSVETSELPVRHPVGAITTVCALRKPATSPIESASSHILRASAHVSCVKSVGACVTGVTVSAFVFAGFGGIRGFAVIANDAQHRLAICFEAREGSELLRHLGRRAIGGSRHQ